MQRVELYVRPSSIALGIQLMCIIFYTKKKKNKRERVRKLSWPNSVTTTAWSLDLVFGHRTGEQVCMLTRRVMLEVLRCHY